MHYRILSILRYWGGTLRGWGGKSVCPERITSFIVNPNFSYTLVLQVAIITGTVFNNVFAGSFGAGAGFNVALGAGLMVKTGKRFGN